MDVDMVYYDHEHTGSSDDIYHANLEGKFYKVKSSICEEVKEWHSPNRASAIDDGVVGHFKQINAASTDDSSGTKPSKYGVP